MSHGSVDLMFFAGAMRLASRLFGRKMCGPPSNFERFRRALAEAEAAYRSLEDEPAKKKGKA